MLFQGSRTHSRLSTHIRATKMKSTSGGEKGGKGEGEKEIASIFTDAILRTLKCFVANLCVFSMLLILAERE